MNEWFEIVGSITDIQTIARGHNVRSRAALIAEFGRGDWRKMKGSALVRFSDGTIRRIELHWYEAHGIGRRNFKIKYRP